MGRERTCFRQRAVSTHSIKQQSSTCWTLKEGQYDGAQIRKEGSVSYGCKPHSIEEVLGYNSSF